jgi:peptidoglycan/LPS O-acetylase OafA/YrhL
LPVILSHIAYLSGFFGLGSINVVYWSLSLAAAGAYVTLGQGTAVVGVTTTVLIAFVIVRSRLLLFLGDISYSLYLVHVPIGGRVINAATRVHLGPTTATLVALTAFGVSVLAAYVFHRLIERPARAWAARIPYGDRREPRPAARSVGPRVASTIATAVES